MSAEPIVDGRPVQLSPRVRPTAKGKVVPIYIPVVDQPWWYPAGAVFSWGLKAALFPLNVVVKAAELVMAAVVMAIVATAAGWYFGYIDDRTVVDALMPIGQRLLSMAQGVSGL